MLSIFVGATFLWLQLTSGNQVIMQRYLSVPGLKEAKQALIGFTLGSIILWGACFYNGLLIYAIYYDCDPLSTKVMSRVLSRAVFLKVGRMPMRRRMFLGGNYKMAN